MNEEAEESAGQHLIFWTYLIIKCMHFVLIEKGRKWSTHYAKCTWANQFHYRYNVWEVRRLYTKGYFLPPLKNTKKTD